MLPEQEMAFPKYQFMLTSAISEFHGSFSRFSGDTIPSGPARLPHSPVDEVTAIGLLVGGTRALDHSKDKWARYYRFPREGWRHSGTNNLLERV